MATGPEHYREAERLAALVKRHPDSSDAGTLAQLMTGHATLALAAATAMQAAVDGCEPGMVSDEYNEWHHAAGVKPRQGGDAG
ncbi:hypothetical protein GKQ77_01455 [Streptomyces sp. BG9H]|uniref:Uncharacterized protein n=1 Tax=Streptomyces anatolicus TaxID=2675858 RepID=A0ABS6YI29_9ACTN|nr:hypothetical protein [Streptomyces anatolicus]MBW5420236.1 hypothetical protein [Streptomyces anatolicus]